MLNMNSEDARPWADTPVDAPGHDRMAVDARTATSGEWLSVADAAAYCAAKGLIRNIKTVRRWAHRSFAHPETAEVLAIKQDTETDFRYVIERSSLDVKIAQEMEFEAKRQPSTALVELALAPDATAHDRPGPDRGEEGPGLSAPLLSDQAGKDEPASVRTGADDAGREAPAAGQRAPEAIGDGDFLKSQIAEKDRQIGNLYRQLERRDEQIMAMLERDRETNILIKGLQEALLPPSASLDETPARRLSVRSIGAGDKPEGAEGEGALQ